LFMLGEIPSTGDRIPLLVDPAKPERFEYDKEATPASSAPAHRSDFEETVQPNIADGLARLAELHERGAINDSEFAAAKKKLLRN